MTHPNGIEIVYEDSKHQYRRIRFRPTSHGWEMETAHHSGCRWVVEGSEPVSKVDIDVPSGAADTYFGP